MIFVIFSIDIIVTEAIFGFFLFIFTGDSCLPRYTQQWFRIVSDTKCPIIVKKKSNDDKIYDGK